MSPNATMGNLKGVRIKDLRVLTKIVLKGQTLLNVLQTYQRFLIFCLVVTLKDTQTQTSMPITQITRVTLLLMHVLVTPTAA